LLKQIRFAPMRYAPDDIISEGPQPAIHGPVSELLELGVVFPDTEFSSRPVAGDRNVQEQIACLRWREIRSNTLSATHGTSSPLQRD
jgi:hypothetical protein